MQIRIFMSIRKLLFSMTAAGHWSSASAPAPFRLSSSSLTYLRCAVSAIQLSVAK
ncbi:hypothetical protein KP509_11G017900 [Ceratopteris richardii]|uniref:Uncharacterized protein n=1 Tax=Ceratopteris richardii TaxID=49495 RepID=A0A8T2TSD3_CERRI|nr:hypothetical protein KP509_11G017900 [Ceratopteris richardii]